MASVDLGVDEVFGISISGEEERRLNFEAWGPYSPVACKRDEHDGFSKWLLWDFCLMNAISQADSDLALKRNHFMDIVLLNSKIMFHILSKNTPFGSKVLGQLKFLFLGRHAKWLILSYR